MKSDVGVLCVMPGWVVTHPELNHSAFRLYAMLAVRLAALGEQDPPTREALATEVGLSADSVDRHLRLLAKVGAIAIEKRGKQNFYTIRYAHPQVTTLSHNYPEAVTPDPMSHTAGILRTNIEQQPAYLLRKRLTEDRKWPCATDIYIGTEVQINKHTEKQDTVADLTVARTSVPMPRFTELYSRYPLQRDKIRASQRWLELGVEDDAALWVDITAGLDRWITYWNQSDTPLQYIPYLTNWLTRQLWEERPVFDQTEHLSPQSRTLARAAKAFLKGEP